MSINKRDSLMKSGVEKFLLTLGLKSSWLKSSWLKSSWLKSSWLKSPVLKSLGLKKFMVEMSGVEKVYG